MKGFRSILNAELVAQIYLEDKSIELISKRSGVPSDLARFAFTLALRGVHPSSLSLITDFRLDDHVRILLADKAVTQSIKDDFDKFKEAWRRLRDREHERRDSIWRLELIKPGSKSAEPYLKSLSEIRNADEIDPIGEASGLSVDEVFELVPITSVPGSIDYVGYDDIPEPWSERFIQASAGSTATIRGGYAGDWKKFIRLWSVEMEMLKRHQEAASV
ncbi:hypothetical protein [Pseudomonas sp. TH31]|uniref:hypothetical protein n=1 Tax=Pseudomonas sp. TH31 TaxID=2796396 RepID=UPI001913307F|nr:hypothetical protein [Pseudomonas sp. TH31]MBK5417759.1 hypothetical protein [Pseudomonas sp. TH31]